MKRVRGRRGWRRWIKRAILLGIALGGSGAAILAAIIVHYGTLDHAQPADVIIVLGGGDQGTARRTRHAAALYARGIAPYLLCSGSAVVRASYTEAEWCAVVAEGLGVPAAAVVLDNSSRDTEENAHQSAAIMRARGWRTAVLVSDDFHLWRASWLFKTAGVTVWTSPAQETTGPLARSEKLYSVGREVAAAACYVSESWVGLRCPHG